MYKRYNNVIKLLVRSVNKGKYKEDLVISDIYKIGFWVLNDNYKSHKIYRLDYIDCV